MMFRNRAFTLWLRRRLTNELIQKYWSRSVKGGLYLHEDQLWVGCSEAIGYADTVYIVWESLPPRLDRYKRDFARDETSMRLTAARHYDQYMKEMGIPWRKAASVYV